jgi:flagellar hook assembly protein FlgD
MGAPLTAVGISNQKKAHPSVEEIMASKRFDNKTKVDMDKDFDDQLKILLATFKNQGLDGNADPNQVMQMVSQYKSLEGMMMLNWRMTEMNEKNKEIEQTLMSKYINKEVKIETQDFIFNGSPIEMAYTLPENATNVTFEIYREDDLKKPVYSTPLDSDDLLGTLSWNGKCVDNTMAKPGHYIMRVSGLSRYAKDTEDKALPIEGKTALFTTIDSIYTDDDAKDAMFVSGEMLIHPKDIKLTRKKAMEAYSKSDFSSKNIQTENISATNQSTQSNGLDMEDSQTDKTVFFPLTASAQHEALVERTINKEV